jgi:hypothetical protein
MRKKLFVLTCRIAIPVFILLVYLVVPAFIAPQGGETILIWLLRVAAAVLLSLAYISVTLLDQTPTKEVQVTFALWRRFGTFVNDRFIAYYDPSAVPYFYFQNAVLMSALTGLLIYPLSPFILPYPSRWFSVLALVNFLFLLASWFVQYPAFRQKVVPPDEIRP